jgi:hypothetical protein
LGLLLLVLLSVFGFLASVKDVFSLIVRLVLGVDACVISLFVLLCCDLNKSSLGCGAWSLVFFKSNWFLELKPLLSFCELVLEFLEFTFQPKGIRSSPSYIWTSFINQRVVSFLVWFWSS